MAVSSDWKPLVVSGAVPARAAVKAPMVKGFRRKPSKSRCGMIFRCGRAHHEEDCCGPAEEAQTGARVHCRKFRASGGRRG